MIPIVITVDYKGLMAELAERHGVREQRKIMKKAHATMGRYWAREMLDRHFTRTARARYGYRPRQAKYLRIKARRKGAGKIEGDSSQDLVYTGRTRKAVKTRTIKAYPTRVTITFPTPDYINKRPRSGRMPLANEILLVTEDERAKLVNVFMGSVQKQREAGKSKRKRKTFK